MTDESAKDMTITNHRTGVPPIFSGFKCLKRYLLYPVIFSLLLSCQTTKAVKTEHANGFDPFTALINVYRGPLDHLSAVRIGECPMYPSDSTYSLQSLKKHGVFMGWIMSLDRLMRCGRDETRLSPQIRVNGKLRTYDPVEHNDFWWNVEHDTVD